MTQLKLLVLRARAQLEVWTRQQPLHEQLEFRTQWAIHLTDPVKSRKSMATLQTAKNLAVTQLARLFFEVSEVRLRRRKVPKSVDTFLMENISGLAARRTLLLFQPGEAKAVSKALSSAGRAVACLEVSMHFSGRVASRLF